MSTMRGTGVAALLVLASLAAPAGADGRQALEAATWGAAVGFAPDLSAVSLQPGEVLDASTWKRAEAWIPEGLADLVARHGMTLRTAAYRPIHPSIGYMDATERHRGSATAIDTGKSLRRKGLQGYVAGLPFPDPKSGLEVAFNGQYAYSGDDGEMEFDVLWISPKRGVERSEAWRWTFLTRAMHRTDLDPRPAFPDLAKRGVQYLSLATALAPYDKAGTMALMTRLDEPQDQRGQLYVPSMRRTLKLTLGAPGVPWNNTDLLFEDIRGYSGYAEWMNWTLVGRATVLAPMHAGVPVGEGPEAALDLARPPHWNPAVAWEPRPVYVVDATPKFWTCPYGRVRFYFDAETFHIPLKVAWDRKGRLAKVVIHAFNASPDEDVLPAPLALSLAVDLRTGHATALPSTRVRNNVGLKPEAFSDDVIRRDGE